MFDKHEWQETREAIRVLGVWRVLYYRLFYRTHMRLLHRYGGHSYTYLDIPDGPRHDWCQWCGHREPRP